jgi:N-acetylglutamate synthase-like GNAT family acetyltransferase
MYFNLSDEIPDISNTSLEIKKGDKDLTAWIQPIREGFSSTDDCETYRKLNATLQQNGEHKLRHFIVYYDKEPASSGTLFLSNNSVMLHNLATKHKFRNKGIVTALTLYMMQMAKNMGFKHCFLDASDEEFHLYQKIGFKVYGVTSVYELKKD